MSRVKTEYTFIGEHKSGLFRRIEFYYSPLHSRPWAIQVNGEARYFHSINDCVEYAKKNKWIKVRHIPAIITNLMEKERAEDNRLFSNGKPETPEGGDFSFRFVR